MLTCSAVTHLLSKFVRCAIDTDDQVSPLVTAITSSQSHGARAAIEWTLRSAIIGSNIYVIQYRISLSWQAKTSQDIWRRFGPSVLTKALTRAQIVSMIF